MRLLYGTAHDLRNCTSFAFNSKHSRMHGLSMAQASLHQLLVLAKHSSSALASTRCMPQALMALAEQTECDVRSCLHTLQFLSRRQRAVRPADIDAARVGQKDITRNAFSAWQELFWLRVSQARTLNRLPQHYKKHSVLQ